MSTPVITYMEPILQAQTILAQSSPPPATSAKESNGGQIWLFTSIGLLLLLIGLGVFTKLKIDSLQKTIKFEQYKIQDLQKKLKLALESIRKMETNPDLVHSREFNLDYLRLRMAEEVFHFAVVNQVKVRVKQIITVALRPNHASQGVIGIASSSGRQVDETFDIVYEMGQSAKKAKRVLFRIQIKLMKLPTQATSATINQIIDCIETFLSPRDDHETWQPTIQGRIVKIQWDQKAKPTPLLVLEQFNEGVNVSFRTKPTPRADAKK